MRASHRSGSLDSIVARSRQRNLAISLGVLGLLAASVALIIAAAQRQQRLARQQMEFVAAVSHELRTPLAVICSAGENLADGVVADAAQVKRYGALIETEGRRLRRHGRARAWNSPASRRGRSRAHRTATWTCRASLPTRSRASTPMPRDRGVTIAVRADGDAAASSSATPTRFGRPSRTSWATPSSTVPISATIDVVGGRCTARRCGIRVVDRGLGIGPEELPHIFKPFYRGRRAMDAQIRGTGVGLSVVRHVVDAHEGRSSVESRPGEGTTVTVDLPVATVADVRSGEHDCRAAVDGCQRAVSLSPRVLIVEDEAGLRLTLTDRLSSEGYAVETADDGEVGLERATTRRLRSHRARRDAAADERLRRLPRGAAARRDDADPDVDGARPGRRQGRRPEARRRRLPDQAVRDDRADGAARGAAAAAAVGSAAGRRHLPLRRRRRRLPARGGDARRRSGVDLSAREFKLLRHFIEHRGATLSRDELLSEVWGYDEMPLTRTVDVHVAGLRQKIDQPQVARVHPHRPRPRLQVRRLIEGVDTATRRRSLHTVSDMCPTPL